ncbi:MAG: tryptophan synthase subunit beta, partial [Candidatus Margulisiibacteriota bacterium]
LHTSKRVDYVSVSDEEAKAAFHLLANEEGILPALESSHALAYAFKLAQKGAKNRVMIINLSGRGDKDLGILLGDK